ncbi:hypothetical protein EDS67_25790 [candidate division KSB1 bacterium]|nr:MAG: hypothetical protein EDS67_25790 [candidate division KSB1 bacterium]MBC6948342.1 hypothetical protein [candidate division KSB1 bacterium]MCE7945017.1 hypothetical protein [Chlorobi bacterium CHB1]MDL1874662.1 hypothetical protein [Cytophagia bacterium CHB2]
MENNNLLNRFIEQLNTLVPFIGIAHEEVFDLVVKERYSWLPQNNESSFPGTFEIYRTQILRSAFLLGYSYFEVFLSDLSREIYTSNPRILPIDKQIKFSEVFDARSFDNLVDVMINKEIYTLFYQGVDKIAEYFSNKFRLTWPDEIKTKIVHASLVRNCILHNMSRTDDRLARISSCQIGQEIQLSSSDIHEFGIYGRILARQLYNEASARYLHSNEDKTK